MTRVFNYIENINKLNKIAYDKQLALIDDKDIFEYNYKRHLVKRDKRIYVSTITGQLLNNIDCIEDFVFSLTSSPIYITNISMLKGSVLNYKFKGSTWIYIVDILKSGFYKEFKTELVHNMDIYISKRLLLGYEIILNTLYYVLLKNKNNELILVSEVYLLIDDNSKFTFAGTHIEKIFINTIRTYNRKYKLGSLMGLFKGCENTYHIVFKDFDTRFIRSFANMFDDCKNLKELDINCFDTRNVTDMSGMFKNCEKLETLNINHFNIRSLKFTTDMFLNCVCLKHLDISSWKFEEYIFMSCMFKNCLNLECFSSNNVKYLLEHASSSTSVFDNTRYEYLEKGETL